MLRPLSLINGEHVENPQTAYCRWYDRRFWFEVQRLESTLQLVVFDHDKNDNVIFSKLVRNRGSYAQWDGKIDQFLYGEWEQVIATMRGILHFHSETGTEGGLWAFQDERYIGIPDDTELCSKCERFREYLEKTQHGDKVEEFRNGRFVEIERSETNICALDAHEWELLNPEGSWSYDGLHILKDGDGLTIFDKEIKEKTVWRGVIDLKQLGLFKEDAFGFWIHADQKGFTREEWATFFFKQFPAELTALVTRRKENGYVHTN